MSQWCSCGINQAQERYRTTYQDEVYPTIGWYNMHKHNNTCTVIGWTNTSMQTLLEYAQKYQ